MVSGTLYFSKRGGKLFSVGVTLALALAAAAAPAAAKSTMTIRADVQRSCDLGALPMMFGTVGIFLPTATAQTSIIINCTPNTAFTVAIDNGQNFNGTQRRMIRTGGGFGTYLNYEIYRDAGRTQRWGTTAAQVVTRVAPANGRVNLVAYGRTNGLVASGAFQDTVTVTLTF